MSDLTSQQHARIEVRQTHWLANGSFFALLPSKAVRKHHERRRRERGNLSVRSVHKLEKYLDSRDVALLY